MKQIKLVLVIMGLSLTVVSCKTKKEAVNPDRPSSSERGRKGRPNMEEVFKMDTNKDGKLSKSEVKGPLLRDFDKIDTSGDGLISKEELEKAPKPQRQQRPRQG